MTNASKESMWNHDVTSKGLWKSVYLCVLILCLWCTPLLCTWWNLLVMYPHVLCYCLVLFTLILIFIWGLESLSHLVCPRELDYCASWCRHLMCNSYLIFLECNLHDRVPLSPNFEVLTKEFDLLVLASHSCVLVHAFALMLVFDTHGLILFLLVWYPCWECSQDELL